jgi:septal ring factor EnvC (AmiA/AmiB activator)
MTEQNSKPSIIVRFFKVLLRLILTLLFGIILGAALYFGFQFAYQELVIPTQQNATNLQNLNTRINQQWDLLQEKNIELEDRLSEMESEQENTTDQISELITDIEQISADLDAYQMQQGDLTTQIEKIDQSIIGLMDQDKDLTAQNKDLIASIENLEVEKKLQPIYQDLQVFKVLLQVNRSRLFLVQNNYGLAKQELELASELLNALLLLATEEQENEILLWDARLNLAIGHLPDNPILASDDLEILWSMMANGFTNPEIIEVIENTAENDLNSTSESSDTATATPTPKP